MKTLSDPRKEQAAQFIAEGRFEYKEIAEKIGVDRITLQRWRKDLKFIKRLDAISAELSAASKRRAIARKDYRIGVLNGLHSKLLTLIEQRGAEPSMADVPGGTTGLLVRQYKVSGDMKVEEYVFDSAVYRELREVAQQAAKELGQLVDKHEHKIKSIEDLSDEQLAALLADLESSETEVGTPSGERPQEPAQS